MTRLEIVQGDTAELRVPVLNAAGVAQNLTNFDDITFTIKRSAQDPDSSAIFQGTLGNSDISVVSPATAGLIDVTVDAASAALMRSGRPYYWDVQLKDGDQKVYTPCSGTIFATSSISD